MTRGNTCWFGRERNGEQDIIQRVFEMIIEMHEEVWRNLTDLGKLALAGRPNVRIGLYDLTRTKRGLKRINERFVEW